VYEMNDFLVLQFSLNTMCCSHLCVVLILSVSITKQLMKYL
jgi:hypothetical protein